MRAVERFLGSLTFGDLVEHELHEVFGTVGDDDILDRRGWVLAGPARLPCRSVSVEPGAGRRYPIAEPGAGVGEVAVPSQRRGAVLLGVVGAQPVQVERREFPDQFGVPMPERRDRRSPAGRRCGEATPPSR